ncbi:MAG: hypothetical protein ACRDNC_06300 [Gaiellaceae bacterium]
MPFHQPHYQGAGGRRRAPTPHALGELGEEALDAAGDVFEAFEDLAEAAWDGATDIVEDGIDAIAAAAEDAWEEIAEAAEEAWESVSEAAEDAWDAISEAVEEVWEDALAAVERAWEATVDAVEVAYEGATRAYEWALATIERTLLWLGDLIEGAIHAIAMLGACLAGIIVHNLAEADNVLLNFGKTPKKLPESFRPEARAIFPDVPLGDVFFIENASLSANHFSEQAAAMTFMNPEVAGINLGYMIYLAGTFDETVKSDRGLMVHELVHVDQYRRFRFEDAFACAYGVGFADAGFSYEKNPLEDQAFQVQRAYMAA